MSLFTLNVVLIVGAFAVFAIPAVIVALLTEGDEEDPREATAEAEAAEILSRMAANQALSSTEVEPYEVLDRDVYPEADPGTPKLPTLWGLTRSQMMEKEYRKALDTPRYQMKSAKHTRMYCRAVAARKVNSMWRKYSSAVCPS